MTRSRRADTDCDLVSDLQRGDLAAFSEIVVRYQQVVCAVAFSACGRQALSEDVAQDTFVAAWKNIAKLEDSAKLKSWLCSIARNRARDALRKRRREVLSDGTEDSAVEFQTTECSRPSPLDRASTAEEEQQVWEALNAIPDGYRETLVLFYREGQSINQVAEGLDLSVAAVKQRLSRGRAALRDSLERVSTCLARTQPSKAFTVGVIAAVAAQSGVAAAASAASVPHPGAMGASKGAASSIAFACVAVLLLAFSGLMVWTMIDLKPKATHQARPQPSATPTLLGSQADHDSVLAPGANNAADLERFAIQGRVVNLFHQGVVGATVTLGGDSQRTTTTDKDGHFDFGSVERGSYALQARSTDSSSRPVPLFVDAETESVRLQLLEGSTLEIYFQDGDDGPPVAGVHVELNSESIVLSATSDQKGVVRFSGITTPLNMASIEAPGFAANKLDLLLSGEPGLHKRTLTLLRGVPVSGVVVNEEGLPVMGAKISLDGLISSPRNESTTSDKSGHFRFATVATQNSTLFVSHDDYELTIKPLALGRATEAVELKVVVARGKLAMGRVTHQDGSPAPYAKVVAQTSGKSVTADAHGNFVIRGLEEQDQTLRASLKIFGSPLVALPTENSSRSLEIVLEDNSVRGTVVDAQGRPIVGAQLVARQAKREASAGNAPDAPISSLSNSKGEFALGPLPSGAEFDLVAAMPQVSPRYLGLERLSALRVESGQRDVEVKVSAPGRLVGSVVGTGGTKINDFALVMANFVEALELEPTSPFHGSDGEFALRQIPKGKYVLAIIADGYEPKVLKGVRIRSDGTTDLGTVTLKRGAVLRGRVVDHRGRGVSGAQVFMGSQIDGDQSNLLRFSTSVEEGADPFEFSKAADKTTRSGADGYFEFPNVFSRKNNVSRQGDMYLAAERSGQGRSKVVRITKGNKGKVVLALLATGQVSGTLVGGGKDVMVSAEPVSDRKRAGDGDFRVTLDTYGSEFRIEGLTPGRYTVTAYEMDASPDFSGGREIEVVAGQTSKIELGLSQRRVTPWTEELLLSFEAHADALCKCTSASCRNEEEDALDDLARTHEAASDSDFAQLMRIEDKLMSCEP